MRLACWRWRLAIADFESWNIQLKLVLAGRQNQHARRVRYPEKRNGQDARWPHSQDGCATSESESPTAISLFPFPLGAAEQRQDEQVCQNVNDTTGEHHQTEPLRRRKIGQHENGKNGGDDHVRIDNTTPLFFACSHPGCPAFLSVALRAANPENKMDHRIDRDSDADIGSRRG